MIFTKHQQNKWLRKEGGENKTSRAFMQVGKWCGARLENAKMENRRKEDAVYLSLSDLNVVTSSNIFRVPEVSEWVFVEHVSAFLSQ